MSKLLYIGNVLVAGHFFSTKKIYHGQQEIGLMAETRDLLRVSRRLVTRRYSVSNLQQFACRRTALASSMNRWQVPGHYSTDNHVRDSL